MYIQILKHFKLIRSIVVLKFQLTKKLFFIQVRSFLYQISSHLKQFPAWIGINNPTSSNFRMLLWVVVLMGVGVSLPGRTFKGEIANTFTKFNMIRYKLFENFFQIMNIVEYYLSFRNLYIQVSKLLSIEFLNFTFHRIFGRLQGKICKMFWPGF